MTTDRNLKRRVRARAAKTGESYTAALRHVRSAPSTNEPPGAAPLPIAVAQSTVRTDPADAVGLRASGAEVRRLMTDAAAAGARLVHFTEGAICFPDKYALSELGPDEAGPADWSRAAWTVLEDELGQVARLAGELAIWTVLAAPHRRPAPSRPHNSLYVVSDEGAVVARYDERTLSNTKLSYLYDPGAAPVTVSVDGYRLGLALGMDVHFPELFTEYERLDVDGVLVSYETGGVPGRETVTTEARGYAAANSYWISLAVPADATGPHAGIIGPRGGWSASCPPDGTPAVAVADVHRDDELSPYARDWRRRTRDRVSL
ncbi:carbon-nitrogen hydrolase family protein [Jiangella sp. DSM 45060]|uniref:carbon-nitrogen hydrolase family protein n=1 Tax=Jiangella sp. DSM 45060 TaxID=1798224 RepID=UPI000879FB2A|nr:carbon-nitrogen hydrolase family protein [Jiangella sp. DSM 45060]SDT72232.1 Predicted amidohydrolase [Jiangella sp. DSM 45060]